MCVIRMDHHCPLIGNCVGLYNHKLYLMSMLHTAVGCGISAYVMLRYWYIEGFL